MKKFLVKLILFALIVLITDYGIDIYLKDGLDRHYGFRNGAEILCIGHSRSVHAINKSRLEQGLKVPVAKYAVAGMDTFDRLAMIRHYLGEHPRQTKVVIYDVDYYTFNGRIYNPEHMKQYKQLFPFMDNADIDSYLKSKSTWSEYYSEKYLRSLRYNDPNVFARAVISHFHSDTIPPQIFDYKNYRSNLAKSGNPAIHLTIHPDTVRCFEETLALLKSNNIRTVLLFLPFVDLEQDRIDSEYRKKVIGMFRQYAGRDPGVLFIDSNMKYADNHRLFYDPFHFNSFGQELVTDDLIGVMKPIVRLMK